MIKLFKSEYTILTFKASISLHEEKMLEKEVLFDTIVQKKYYLYN